MRVVRRNLTGSSLLFYLITDILFQVLFLGPAWTVHGQILNGNNVIAGPPEGSFVPPPPNVGIPPAQPTSNGGLKPTGTTTVEDPSKPANGTSSPTTTAPPPPMPTTPPPPVPVQPFTTIGFGPYPVPVASPLPLPTTPALFPQNISSCSICYGMFPTLSRCNVIANQDTYPITPNSTYESLLPYLKCICTYKALDAYPYCIDCFTKTQQLNQLNVLQANHLENYVDAFRQMCGATFNGNKIPDKNGVPGSALRGSLSERGWMNMVLTVGLGVWITAMLAK
ncbi:hypothetical protein BGW38_000411 [Lunasporangiospora selenospora]|uniref:Uncharacterized protein n=1 Tax=Lunasporangiospora selenospora TaxID=979761 RepID=A0A9P6G1V8_9FUNG|nr:hypothetical protein BGW38_000411 [Lunasporangiospora selenospora]